MSSEPRDGRDGRDASPDVVTAAKAVADAAIARAKEFADARADHTDDAIVALTADVSRLVASSADIGRSLHRRTALFVIIIGLLIVSSGAFGVLLVQGDRQGHQLVACNVPPKDATKATCYTRTQDNTARAVAQVISAQDRNARRLEVELARIVLADAQSSVEARHAAQRIIDNLRASATEGNP